MAISVICPCGKHLACAYELAGKQIRCPICHRLLRVSGKPEESAAVPSAWAGRLARLHPALSVRPALAWGVLLLLLLSLVGILSWLAYREETRPARLLYGAGGLLAAIAVPLVGYKTLRSGTARPPNVVLIGCRVLGVAVALGSLVAIAFVPSALWRFVLTSLAAASAAAVILPALSRRQTRLEAKWRDEDKRAQSQSLAHG